MGLPGSLGSLVKLVRASVAAVQFALIIGRTKTIWFSLVRTFSPSFRMPAFTFFAVSVICFLGALISLVMAITSDETSLTSAGEHWKNAIIFGAIAPIAAYISVQLFWRPSQASLEAESNEDRQRRLDQRQRDVRSLGINCLIQGVFAGLGSGLMLILRGFSPVFAVAVGAGISLIGLVIVFISLNKRATSLAGFLGRFAFVLFVGSQIAAVFVVLVLVVAVQFELI